MDVLQETVCVSFSPQSPDAAPAKQASHAAVVGSHRRQSSERSSSRDSEASPKRNLDSWLDHSKYRDSRAKDSKMVLLLFHG